MRVQGAARMRGVATQWHCQCGAAPGHAIFSSMKTLSLFRAGIETYFTLTHLSKIITIHVQSRHLDYLIRQNT